MVGVKYTPNISWLKSLEPVKVTLHGKIFFVNVIKDLGMGDYPALSGWVVNVISGAYKRVKERFDFRQKRRRPHDGSREEANQRERRCYGGLEDGGGP